MIRSIIAALGLMAVCLPAMAQTRTEIPGPFGSTVVQGTKPPVMTVATLPACNANTAYLTYVVTDANAATFNAVVAGGGAIVLRAFCNGTAWVAQ